MRYGIKDIFGYFIRIILEFLSIIFALKYNGVKSPPLPPIKNKIVTESATEIARKIRTKKVTSEEVVNAFIERIKDVNPLLNAFIQERFIEARKEAIEIDTFIKTSGKTEEELSKEKPLLGVPFTIKDSYDVRGLKNTCGLWARRDRMAKEDAECVRLLKEAGAVNLGMTNVPELCMWWETNNTVYGRTNCAYDVNRTTGGSSGGEGSLQSACGTPISIGSDIGGSIRLPSFFNGIFGHKPTADVVSNNGTDPNLIGLYDKFCVTGPLCKYSDDISLVLKVLAGKNNQLLSLDKKVDLRKIKLFYMENDGGNPLLSGVNPEITFAQRRVLNHFQDEFKVTAVKANFKQIYDAGDIFFAKLGSEKAANPFSFEFGNREEHVPLFREFLKFLIGRSKHTLPCLFNIANEKFLMSSSSEKYLDLCDDLEREFKELLGDNGVLIFPTQPKNDIYRNGTFFCPFNFVYTAIWNLICVPATQCPLGLASNNLPIGVQVIANKYQDHLCLAVAKEIEKTFGGWVNPSQILTT